MVCLSGISKHCNHKYYSSELLGSLTSLTASEVQCKVKLSKSKSLVFVHESQVLHTSTLRPDKRARACPRTFSKRRRLIFDHCATLCGVAIQQFIHMPKWPD